MTFFRERTIQASNRLWEAISASGHKIVSSRIAFAPTRQFDPTTEHPRTCAVGSTCALFAIALGPIARFHVVRFCQCLFEISAVDIEIFLCATRC